MLVVALGGHRAPAQDSAIIENLRRTVEAIEGDGVVIAANAVDVSNAVTSIIDRIHFDAEQSVRTGDRLFSLDPIEFELAVAAAEAEVLRARARLGLALVAFDRARRLAASGTGSAVALEEATAERDIADAELRLAEVRLRTAEADLGFTEITAPIDGIVGPPLVSVGAFVEAEEGEPLARIVQLDPIFVAYEEPYATQLEMLAAVAPDGIAPNWEDLLQVLRIRLRITDGFVYPVTSTPSRVGSTVNPETGRITIWAEFANPDHLLRPGMRVTVTSELDDAELKRRIGQ